MKFLQTTTRQKIGGSFPNKTLNIYCISCHLHPSRTPHISFRSRSCPCSCLALNVSRSRCLSLSRAHTHASPLFLSLFGSRSLSLSHTNPGKLTQVKSTFSHFSVARQEPAHARSRHLQPASRQSASPTAPTERQGTAVDSSVKSPVFPTESPVLPAELPVFGGHCEERARECQHRIGSVQQRNDNTALVVDTNLSIPRRANAAPAITNTTSTPLVLAILIAFARLRAAWLRALQSARECQQRIGSMQQQHHNTTLDMDSDLSIHTTTRLCLRTHTCPCEFMQMPLELPKACSQ